MTKDELREVITPVVEHEDLKTLRAIINGKLSKRKITPEQRANMQAAKKAKVNNRGNGE